MDFAFGSFSRRSTTPELLDARDADPALLSDICDWHDLVNRRLGGYHIVLAFLSSAKFRTGGSFSVLDMGCGAGGLSRTIVAWARAKGLDVRVHGADHNPALIGMAREKSPAARDLSFETRDLSDPFYLQAQQFDYVVSLGGWRRESDERSALFLKTANRLARRGVIVADNLRDVRPALYGAVAARLLGRGKLAGEVRLSFRRGFTSTDAVQRQKEAGLDFARFRLQFGYRFSIEGERGLAMATELAPDIGLAGA